MLTNKHRFHGHNSLNFVYRHGQQVRSDGIAIKYKLNKKRTTHRVAVVISKKVYKSAVKRNRIRRRIFEQIRLLEPRISAPYDIIITVFSEKILDTPPSSLAQTLENQLSDAGILS